MFKSIVVAFDGSLHASRALEIGATLAGQEQAQLGIIYVIDANHTQIPEAIRSMGEVEHIIDPMPRMVVKFEEAPINMVSTMTQTASDSEKAMFQYADFLASQAEQSARDYGAEDIESKAVLGSPAEEIVVYAREREADLIITGSRGLGKLKSLVLGSTSNKVSQLADCSCLTVK